VVEVPSLLLTTTFTRPVVVLTPERQTNVEAFTDVTAQGTPPNATVAPVLKLLPVIVTIVPPEIGPAPGLTPEIVGVGPW